jgi:hypothetical protein
MERARSSRRGTLKIQRACERSRLHGELVIAAYELAAPMVRKRLSPPEVHSRSGCEHRSARERTVALGGISA